jgi:hypothetical protein
MREPAGRPAARCAVQDAPIKLALGSIQECESLEQGAIRKNIDSFHGSS